MQAQPAQSSLRDAAPQLAPPPLGQRMLAATAWLLASNLSSQALRLLSNLLLTRLLLPEAFGLVAVANTLYFALVMFSDLGIWQSVVRSQRSHEARFLGTAWTVQLLRGLLLALILLALALAAEWARRAGICASGTVYADPRLPALTAAFACSALLQGLESIKVSTAQRDLQTRLLARLDLAAQLFATAVTLALAWLSGSVWALALGSVAGSALRACASHYWLPGPGVRPCWDGSALAELVGFGKWVFLSSIIGFMAAHGEKLILGASLQVESFGLFAIAATLVAALAGIVSSLNGHISYTSLSQALRSSDAHEAERIYSRLQQTADWLLGFVSGALLGCGQWLIWLLYDPRYRDAGWMLQWLALGLLAMRHQVLEQLMFARGRPELVSASNMLRAFSLVLTIPAGQAMAGEAGAIGAVVLSQFAGWPLALRYKSRQGLLCAQNELLWIPALAAGLALGLGLAALLETALPALASA